MFPWCSSGGFLRNSLAYSLAIHFQFHTVIMETRNYIIINGVVVSMTDEELKDRDMWSELSGK